MNYLFGLTTALKIVFAMSLLSMLTALFVRLVYEFERGVLFQNGKFKKVVDPGIVFLVPLLNQLDKVDMREFEIEIPRIYVVMKDAKLLAVEIHASFQVSDAAKAVIETQDYYETAKMDTVMIVSDYLSQITMDDMVKDLPAIKQKLREFAGRKLSFCGLRVVGLEINPVITHRSE
ncbi:MAG: SPFH domain-containing protein [Candidatus Omnitrophica bacterium]|nr:SPFH domain-containing protein [Candidatus Omnitrophota bacterium]